MSDERPLPAGASERPIPAGVPMTLTVVLRPHSPGELAAIDAAVGDPGNGLYRHFLTEAQYETRFHASPDAATSVERYFAGFGGKLVGRSADGAGLTLHIPAAGVRDSLGVVPVAYRSGSNSGYTTLGVPRLPNEVAALVSGIDGLSHATRGGLTLDLARLSGGKVSAESASQFIRDNASGESWYYGTDFAQAYRVDHLFPGPGSVPNATFPTGEAIATILISGFNASTGVDLPPFNPQAIRQYYNDSFPAGWPKPVVRGSPVTIASVTPPAPGRNAGLNDSTRDQSENSIDLEMAGSLAPGATLVNFYFSAALFDSNQGNGSGGSIADAFGQALSSALSYNYGSARLTAVTNSFGLPDLNNSLWNQELQHAQALGVTVLAASGDQGNAPESLTGRPQGQWPGWPATAAFDTFGTVSVGGVSVGLGGTPTGTYYGSTLPTGFDSNLTGIASSVAWWEDQTAPGNYSGSEGGVSTTVPEPSWQFDSAAQPAISNASGVQGVTALGRTGPDLAMPANRTIAYIDADATQVYFDIFEGTSIASPLLAGELASLAAVAGHPYGFVDPELYRVGSYYTAFPSPSSPFLDVTSGSNYVFSAGPGWDPVTGWGQLDAPNFLVADANLTIASYRYVGPTPGLPPLHLGAGPAASNLFPYAVLVGAALAFVVAVVIVWGGRSRAHAPPPGIAGGAFGTAGAPGYGVGSNPFPPSPGNPPAPLGGGYPPTPSAGGGPAWFACPYCGAPRPAEPVRCPYCGVL
ncbi:MAG: S8 family serine peptidase [Thermoplasmata archaeon]|nr:S8 family serine peptidase [Thermoplasmata archaeon]